MGLKINEIRIQEYDFKSRIWNIVSNVKSIDEIYIDENKNSFYGFLKNKFKENLDGRICIFENIKYIKFILNIYIYQIVVDFKWLLQTFLFDF